MFDATIILNRDDILVWASAGTLTSDLDQQSGIVFDWSTAARRDAQLSRRDIALANSIADVAATVATVWGGTVAYSAPPEPQGVDIPGEMAPITNVAGTVAHVKPSSVPGDSYTTDQDLLQRDLVILEGLRQVTKMVPDAVISGTLPGPVELSVAWSLAEGAPTGVSVSPILPMAIDTFKSPDEDLANNDNQLALNVASLSQLLSNPFLMASRLIVQSSDGSHEAESYVLISEDSNTKVWQAEPGIEGRMRVTYDKLRHTLAWTDETESPALPYPQPYAVGGTISGPIEVLPALDEAKDVEFWRKKATQVNLLSVKEVQAAHVTDPGLTAMGDAYESHGAAVFVQAGTLTTIVAGTLDPGTTRVALLAASVPEVVVDGAKGVGGTPTGFATDFPASGGTILWGIQLTPGLWSMTVYFTNVLGTAPTSWPFLVQLGTNVVSALGLRFTKDNGEVDSANYAINAPAGPVTLSLAWGPPDASNQLRIERIVFTRQSAEQTYSLSAFLGSTGPATVEVDMLPYRLDVLSFAFETTEQLIDPVLTLLWEDTVIVTPNATDADTTPLSIFAVDAMNYHSVEVTKNADGFEAWKSEMVERAAESVVDAFNASILVDPGFDPTVLVYGTIGGTVVTQRYWTLDSTNAWLNYLRESEARFDLALREGGPGDIGRPAIIPMGLKYDFDQNVFPRSVTLEEEVINDTVPLQVTARVAGTLCTPILAAYQPWMARISLPVFVEDFWAESRVGGTVTTVD